MLHVRQYPPTASRKIRASKGAPIKSRYLCLGPLGHVRNTSKNRLSLAQRISHLQARSTPDDWWSLHVDGASRSSGSGVGLFLKAPTGERLGQSIRLDFPASNNEAEYEAILSGLELATTLNASKVKIHSDLQLVVGQILKKYEAKDESMAKYLLKV
ncbi:hypothetical protein CK203_103248 [Vitis vinifera]|uniref:RNase H type-1 domain-containing protein n=1 Tax=Vitis vinifera TaxID=29760 RepID=A0A438D8B8_VITVI|nr:hypothetical protein CK203_103248 [Vitis vinifera]